MSFITIRLSVLVSYLANHWADMVFVYSEAPISLGKVYNLFEGGGTLTPPPSQIFFLSFVF